MICPTAPGGAGARMTRPGNAFSLSTTNWELIGKLIASSILIHHRVIDTLRPGSCRGDHTKPSVLEVPVVGCSAVLPPVIDCTTTVSPLRRGSVTVMEELESGAARLYSVGGLNAVACVPRTSRSSMGRNSTPACHVVLEPKSLESSYRAAPCTASTSR